MFKQLSPSIIEKMRKDGRVMLTIKPGWEKITTLSAAPYRINLFIGREMEHLFNCYLQMYGKTVVVSNIEPSPYINTQKNILDSYFYVAVDGLIKFTKTNKKTRIIVDTTIKCAADHLPHYGFKLLPEADYPTNSIKGILLLK